MNFSDLLNNNVISNITNKLGVDQNQATALMTTAVPLMLSALQKNASTPQGAESLNNALQQHDGSILNNLASIFTGQPSNDGQKIVNHMFGGQTDQVTNALSAKTGITQSKIAPILAILAPIVMAYLGRQKNQTQTNAGGLGDLLGGILGGGNNNQATAPTQQQNGGGIFGTITNMLDKDKDGSVIDDIFDMFKK